MAAKKKAAPSVVLPKDWPAAAKTQSLSIATLQNNPRNFRTHPEAQILQLMAAYDEFGVVTPAVVDEKGLLLKGHGQIEAARRKEFTHYPCIVVRGWSDVKKRKYMASDNQSFELGGYDDEARRRELEDLRSILEPADLLALGFDEHALDKLLAETQPPDGFQEFGDDIATEHECPKCGYKFSGGAKTTTAKPKKDGKPKGDKKAAARAKKK